MSGVQSHCLVIMKHVVIRIAGVVEHSKGRHDEPSWWLGIKNVLPKGEREHVIGTSNHCCRRYLERIPCSKGGVNWLHERHCAHR